MSFWRDFRGGTARREAGMAHGRNTSNLEGGVNAMRGYYRQGYDDARGAVQPYAQGGRKAYDAHQNLLGLNGAEAQGQARQGYQGWNPFLSGDMDDATQAVDRRMAATGQYGGGMAAMARDRVARQMGTQDFYNYSDRLAALGGQGAQAANLLANLGMQHGGNMAGAEQWYRQGLINNDTNYHNARANASQTGVQNMIGLGTAIAQMAMGMPPTAMGNIGKGQSTTQPGTSMNSGWSTTTTPANNYSNLLSDWWGR